MLLPNLDLPVDSIRMLPPQISINGMLRKNREFRKMFSRGLPTEAERLERKVNVEFVL